MKETIQTSPARAGIEAIPAFHRQRSRFSLRLAPPSNAPLTVCLSFLVCSLFLYPCLRSHVKLRKKASLLSIPIFACSQFTFSHGTHFP
jgi:hypothetical protein